MSPHEAPIQAGGESQDSGLEAGAGGRGAEGTGVCKCQNAATRTRTVCARDGLSVSS